MILVDTSIWIDHLRAGDKRLAAALEEGEVWTHPFVLGELACGNLRNRREVLDLLSRLPRVPMATDAEVHGFIERHALMGRGLGLIDVHLLAATALATPVRLWSRDKTLAGAASRLKLADDRL